MKILIKFLYPLLKLSKPYLRKVANEQLIPEIKKATKLGKADKVIDKTIADVINNVIDAI
jgi:hypothetical protein